MKENMKTCNHNFNGAIYKDVVVIGNGPSGLVTSFMLAGNVPYLKEIPDDLPLDDMLKARLSNVDREQSLFETDLLQLAEGLEGRSHNPIPLLMDNLLRPCADMGVTADPLIEWRFEANKQIDHIVVGRGPPGGSWHTFPSRVLTLSPAAWLTLPPHVGGGGGGGVGGGGGRISAANVAKYCKKYVSTCKLQKYFRNGVVVTSVSRGPLLEPCDRGCHTKYNYHVTGYEVSSQQRFSYWCRRVVVCAGGCDLPNSHTHARYCVHTLGELTRSLEHIDNRAGVGNVLVVGSGMSAADALVLLQHVRTLHAHRRASPLAALPPHDYPDYHRIYKMMCDGPAGNHDNYTSLLDHVITDIVPVNPDDNRPDKLTPKRVTLRNTKTNEIKEVTVSLIAVLIGSRPDLFFLQTNSRTTLDAKCKCTEEKQDEDTSRCFFKNHWHYLKTVLGQTVQICKSRYLNYSEINGNDDTKCIVDDCRINNNILENGVIKTRLDDYCKTDKSDEIKCYCKQTASYSNGLGFGLDPNKPVDSRNNPIAIDISTHEVLYAPKGVYALGPVTGDNFIRFLPGGALATVAHMHKEKTK